jgi:hypothetical protein
VRDWEKRLWRWTAKADQSWASRSPSRSRRSQWGFDHPRAAAALFAVLWGLAMSVFVLVTVKRELLGFTLVVLAVASLGVGVFAYRAATVRREMERERQ